jgi:hypothetical protein
VLEVAKCEGDAGGAALFCFQYAIIPANVAELIGKELFVRQIPH